MYYVSDLKKAEIFYVNILGLIKKWEDKSLNMIGFVMQESDSEVVIHNSDEIPKFDYAYLVKNVDSFLKEFKQKGGKIKSEPINVRCGKFAVILDSDNNQIPIIDLTKFGGKPRYD